MTLVAQRSFTGAEVRPNYQFNDRRRRRLSTIVKRQADRSRPFIVSVHRRGQPVAANDLDVVLRKEWQGKLVGGNDIVLITYLPQGGGGGKGGSILMAIAAIALSIVVPFAVAAIPGLGAIGGGLTLAGKIVSTGIIMGGMALLGQAFKPKANKPEETKPVYGVSGGGNLPRPGDRIPKLYGRCWTVPDLSQPDYFEYQGEEYQVLYKRMTITLGNARVFSVRVNGQLMASYTNGIVSGRFPSDSIRPTFEGSIIEVIPPGGTSTLVPGDVVSAPNVQGNELARPDAPGGNFWSGPFLIADPSIFINKIQIDVSAPGGLMHNFSNSKGSQEAASPYGWEFEYAEVNNLGDRIGEWKRLDRRDSSKLARRTVRWTIERTVPEGRYMVRGRNIYTNTPPNERTSNITNALQWDGLRGHINDKRIRPHVTEIAIKVKSSAALGITSFANIEVEAQSRIPVWNGSSWPLTDNRKAVWAFADIMRNTTYGAALPDSSLDLETLQFYADALSQFDTFDGVIRGPDSVWNVASAVLLPMRAEPVQLGRVWSLVRDDRKDVRPHVITSRQIVGGSSGLRFDLDPDNGESHYIAEYYDKADPRRLVQLDDVIYGNPSITPTRRSLFGVSSRAHAQHLTKWLASSAFYRRQKVTFQTEYDGRIYKRGDPIAVETWFASKSKVASVIERSGDTLTLDRAVTVAAGDRLIIRDRSGREWGPVLIAVQPAPDQVVLDPAHRAFFEGQTGISLGNALALDNMDETTVRIGQGTTLTRNYLVKVAKPNGRDRMDIEAVIDHQAVWDILAEPIIDVPDGTDDIDPLPPNNITVNERLYLEGDEVKAAAQISWNRTDPRALNFEVEYRIDFRRVVSETDPDVVVEETASDGEWIPLGTTSNTSIEVLDVPAAQIDIRVRSIYTATGISTWAYYNNAVIAGVLKPPSDVTGFEASVLGDLMTLAWDPVTDTHLQHYEVRFSPALSGVEWGTAVPLVLRATTNGAQVPAAAGTYLVKAVSRAGRPSRNAAVIVSDVAGLSKMNAIEILAQHPTFAGAKTNVTVNEALGGLQLTYAGSIFDRPNWFGVEDFFLGTEGIEPDGSYDFAESLDLGAVYTSRLSAVLEAFGLDVTSNLFARMDFFAVEDFFQSEPPATWGVSFEYRTTNDNPAGAPVWGDWRPVVIGDVTARAFQFRVLLYSYEFAVTPVVTRLEATIDMPDRHEGGNDLAVPTAGLRVNFVPPFLSLKALAITGQGLQTGDTYAITNKSETGYDIRFFNSSGTAVARTHDFVALGYGRKE